MKLLINDMDFQKCGEIIVSAKHNVFAMSCSYCHQRFSQFQAFMRHMQLHHADKLEFGNKEKNIEVYAVEELMTTLNQTSVEDAYHEASGEEVNDGNWLTDEDQKWLDEGDAVEEKDNANNADLTNISILKALEDCDVSLNLVDNLDTTNYGLIEEDLCSDKEEDDDVLNNTLLQQIQNDCDVSDSVESHDKSPKSAQGDANINVHGLDVSQEFNGDVTTRNGEKVICKDNLNELLNNKKESLGIKGLFEGLEDLDDIDSLLENLENSLACEGTQNEVRNLLNSKQLKKDKRDCKKDKIDYNFEAPVLEDLELTVNHKDDTIIHQAVMNYKLAIKDPKDNEKLPIMSKTLKKNQQKMVINIESGELENVNNSLDQFEDSLEEENFIFNNFVNKSIIENETIKREKSNIASYRSDSVMDNHISQKDEQQDSEDEDFEVQLKNLEKSLDTDNIILKEKNQKKILKNSSQDRMDFNLQLMNLEESLNEDNTIYTNFVTKNSQKVTKTIINSNNYKRNNGNLSKNNLTKLKNDSESRLYPIKELSTEISKDISNILTESQQNTRTNKNNFQDLDVNSRKSEKNHQEILSIAPLNNDLTKALEEALGCNDFNLQNMEVEEDNEITLNQDLKDLLVQELLQEDIETKKPLLLTKSIKPNTNKSVKVSEVILKETEGEADLNMAKSLSRYEKTNLKAEAKNMRQKLLFETKNANQNTVGQNMNNLSTKLPLKNCYANRKPLKGNHELNIQKQQKPFSQNLLKSITPKKSPEGQEISVLKTIQVKTSIKKDMENYTPDFLKKIKQEKFTPHKSFINTERGDRTPLQRDELFLKLSPRTQDKHQGIEENFTPKRGETTPKTKEQLFLKQSTKTQEKNEELSHDKKPTRGKINPNIREQLILKQSPKTQEKSECSGKRKIVKTPGKLKECPKLDKTLLKEIKVQLNRKSPAKTTPLELHNCNAHLTPVTTPQRMRNLTIKLPRLTPDKLKQNAVDDINIQLQIFKSPQSPTNVQEGETTTNKTLRNTENIISNKVNNFKLPNDITMTKISPSNNIKHNHTSNINQTNLVETPIKSNYCNQNFSEATLEQHILQKGVTNDIPLTLNNAQNQVLNSKPSFKRQRKASIDIVPSLGKKQSNSSTKSTPKHTNIDYKSYAINRSTRKKEVLQRMRHIKKQIFRSIENGQELIKLYGTKSPPNKPKKNKLHIENVQVLPNLKRELLTPLINPFDNFKKPLTQNVATALSVHTSPKNLNDDEKQAKKSLHMPASSSSINDDEKLTKKSLKRPAISPVLDDGKQAKRLPKSPSSKDGCRISSDLEVTQLGLSESVVEFLQRDLKTNRLNVDSFLNEDLPIEDNSPKETSGISNGKAHKTEDKAEESTNSSNTNILDELLHQVDNEEKTYEVTEVHNKEIPNDTSKATTISNDFDETKDLHLLNKFGLRIIKSPDIEDLISLEESEEMKEKAKKFADIYKTWQRIWSSKNGENSKIRQELDISFQQLLTQTNLTFKLDLNIIHLKRLVNLITFWYAHSFNSKLIEKKKISEATNNYLLLFHYIPKTTKRLYYCEYCEEYFTTEHRYFTHRILHTGALYPYRCMQCTMGFRVQKAHKEHELQCRGLKTTSLYKCRSNSEKLESSTQLNEHSKTHLKTAYNCVKCDLVFASAANVQKHMTLCNRNVKRMPKQLTPRPPKPDKYSNN